MRTSSGTCLFAIFTFFILFFMLLYEGEGSKQGQLSLTGCSSLISQDIQVAQTRRLDGRGHGGFIFIFIFIFWGEDWEAGSGHSSSDCLGF